MKKNKKLISEYEFIINNQYNKKNYIECIKNCFALISMDPCLEITYKYAGNSFLKLKMYSQAKGCYQVAQKFCDENHKENYDKLIELCSNYDQKNIN